MTLNTEFLEDVEGTSTKVEPHLVVDDVDSFHWDEQCDVLVVGAGLAGAATTLRVAEEARYKVIAIDRGMGGGASKMSGGVIYMGGGTPAQQECGIEDSPENMANYLQFEVGDIVRPETLQRFAYASKQFQPWLETHGARFGGPVTDAKTSYPNDACLYFSGNEVTPAGVSRANPVPRGHRAKPAAGGEPAKLSGAYLLPPLLDAMDRQANIHFYRQTRAKRMILNADGDIVGVEVLRVPGGFSARWHAWCYALGANMIMAMLKLTDAFQRAVLRMESKAELVRIRVHKGVVLSAGGFTYNRKMMAKTAPQYLSSAPLGTIADDGSGIKLGMTVGAGVDKLDRISAWKFLYPPAAWTRSCSIGPSGERLVSEEFYGARTGEAVFKTGGGKGWLILDAPLQAMAEEEIQKMKKMLFQKVQFKAILNDYTVSADTLPELAAKLGVPAQALMATIETYNRHVDEGRPDPFGKTEKLRQTLKTGPFYATDIGAAPKLAPIPALTMGGLVCDEISGQVLDGDGEPIKGLFAAGRTAVGICSNYYVSGLSLADCVWSGWRAAETLKGNEGAKTLAPHI
ncbi:FAD-binding protein [Aestuariicella hydrocarbonica]|uniref:FAD-binding protein n=1 Tax=Pseudomaricurvus hydrocarbonicus TaxID=1470433 RepID=A0A9E5T403_9GAMM|nr:FAD-binding protein [Aestuariicella hydrocarbonica]NHO67444.1 FAD-binding protein [Aestuariicella hydrocarbonica]